MSAKRVDKNHPDYSVYIEKCRAMWVEFQQRIDEEEAKYPDLGGLDHPASVITRQIDRERNTELRKLQQEYDYLFTVEIPDEEND